ncbi:MAG: putative phage abortive infection protein [Bacteroidetes bacterium]|nr:putative phage abortive infection protein [Bacteroidota bacterium]
MKKKEIIIIGFAVILFMWFSINILYQTGFDKNIDFDIASKYGALLGGVFSFLSVWLIYLTLRKQSEVYDKTLFENRFFELVRFHRANVEELPPYQKYIPQKDKRFKKEEIYRERQHIFNELFWQIMESIKVYDSFMKDKDYCLPDILNAQGINYYEKLEEKFKQRKFNTEEIIRIEIAYLILFFGIGIGENSTNYTQKILKKKYNDEFVTLLMDYFKEEISKKQRERGYFAGQQVRLGHYFRHLYQTVKYVDKQDFNYSKKYEYIKLYRAQFSTFEQAIIFFNSLSELGKNWEFSQEKENDMLITKYNLIKNIPPELISVIDIKKYYPKVIYEFDSEQTEERKELERKELEKKYK